MLQCNINTPYFFSKNHVSHFEHSKSYYYFLILTCILKQLNDFFKSVYAINKEKSAIFVILINHFILNRFVNSFNSIF